MAEAQVPNTVPQRSSKIARFIPRPQRVVPKKLENFTQLLPKATPNVPSAAEPHSQTVLSSSNHHSAAAPVEEALKRPHRNLKIGDPVSIGESKHGVLRYYGETHFAEGILCGVELEDAAGGKHSGTVDGVTYFVCRPNHGIFVPEPNVKLRVQQSVPTLPELSAPAPVENDPPAVQPKSSSALSRLPKLGLSGKFSLSRQREAGTSEESCEVVSHHSDLSSEADSYRVVDAPLWRDTYTDDSPGSDSEDHYQRDSSLNRHVSPEVLQELRNALMSELPPQQPAPDPSAAVKNALSPIHENADECENRNIKKALSQSPEGAVGGVDFLSPIAETMDEMDDGSKQESLGILTDGAMRDVSVSISGVLPNSFSTDDVADLLDDEVDDDDCAPCTTLTAHDTTVDDNIPMISSNVLRILQYNFPDQVDYLNTVVARSGAIITNEPPPLSRSASETSPSVATDLNTDESSARKTSDSLECSSGFATSIGSVECELPGAADALTAVNLSSLQGEEGARPKRPTSAYTVRSTDTGFQGDSEVEYQSEAGTAVSPCEDKMMRWSTCSSQDSGAVSESEFHRRNLHPDCCSDCDRVPSPAGRHQPSLRLQAPESQNPMLAVKQDEAAATAAPQEQPAASSEEATVQEEQAKGAADSSPEVRPAESSAEGQASEEPALRAEPDKQEAPSAEDRTGSPEKAAAKVERTVTKRVPISFPKPAPKVVVSKVKAMIEASKTESEEAAKRVVRQPKKSRWDEVTSKLAASMADDKAKPKVKEVRSRVFTNLEGAKQQPVRPTALLPTLRKSLRCNTSSRGSIRTEADDATPTSEFPHGSPAGDSSKDDTADSTTTAADGSVMKGADVASVHSSGKGAASVKSALSERKTKPPPKRPDYPRPWNVASKPAATKEVASMIRPALSRRTSPTQPKSPCMHSNKTVHFSDALPTSIVSASAARRTDGKKAATTGASSRLSAPGGPASKAGEARVQTKAEFTREIQRLGALCESRTKELTMLKMQLRHASIGFSSFGVIIQHLSAQNDSFCIPKLSEELQKSQEEIEKARIAIEEYKDNIEELKRNQEQEIEALKAELDGKHALKIQELEAAHKNELTCYLESHTRKLEEMKTFYTGIIEGDRKSHEETLDSLKQRHREKIDAINEEYSLQLDSIHEDHQIRQRELDARHEALLQQHQSLQQKAQEFQQSVLLDTDAKIQWLSKKNAELLKEVESLNVVLEMRADQIQALQRSTVDMERKDEELGRCKAKMEKMEARIEDLQELLNEKVKLQSQLSVENARLRETSEKQNRQLSRLDMHNEELKYKLRESVNSSMLDGTGHPRSRNSPHKRYSVADPTAMSQSWHAAEHRSASRASNGKPLGGAHGPHRGAQGSQSLPRGCSDGFHPRMRRSMSETSPPQDACVRQLFASFITGDSGDSSTLEDAPALGDACSTPRQCSQDDLLRLTWVQEDGGLLLQQGSPEQPPQGPPGSSS